MRAVRALLHTAIVLGGLFCILGIPFLASGAFSSLLSGNADALTAATVTLDQPSGNYLVLINREFHTDSDKLEDWVTFFQGSDDFTYIFEDVVCAVPSGDTGALDMARSFQSQLPENQMTVKIENSTLLLSRADHGKFDIIVLSQELADANHVTDTIGEEVLLLRVEGGTT